MARDITPGDRADPLFAPAYWLVAGMEWPGGPSPAEAAWAVAPDMIPRDMVSSDTYQVLGCADQYVASQATRIVFFSDLTRMFTIAGTSWANLGVDWEAALDELQDGPYATALLAVSERAHILICDPSIELHLHQPGRKSDPDWARRDRELVRQSITETLIVSWPTYIDDLIQRGRLRIAN
jgi:hypothetical protein